MEILRWTGRPRMALLNNLSDEADFTDEWKQHLGEYFNLTRDFNAHHARFTERIRLLRQLLEIEDDRKPAIEKTIQLLETEWDQRRSESADVIIELLEDCLKKRTTRNVSDANITRDYQREKIAAELKEKYTREVAALESAHHAKLRKIYRHASKAPKPDDVPAGPGLGELFSEETWQFLGLDKWQLALAGGIAGAVGGSVIDAAVGGSTLGLGTVIGGLAGAATPLVTGRALAQIKIDIPFLPGQKASTGGIRITAGPPVNPNFPWILLDRALFHYHELLVRAHGRRDPFIVKLEEGSRAGFTSKFPAARRRQLQSWFTKLLKGKTVTDTSEIFEEMRTILEEVQSAK